MGSTAEGAYRCSFCGEDRDMGALFAGTRGALICRECVELLAQQLAERPAEPEQASPVERRARRARVYRSR